jgi:hypothetical protein
MPQPEISNSTAFDGALLEEITGFAQDQMFEQ